MGGSPEKSSSTSTSGSAQQWAQPYAAPAAQSVLDVYKAQQPNLSALQTNLNGQIGAMQGQAKQIGAQNAQYGATAGHANSYLNNVIGGGMMSGNPYIHQLLGTLDQGIVNNVGSGFETAGRYGSGNYVGELAKQIGAANSNVLYQNYSDEANRQMQAANSAQAAQIASQQAVSDNQQQQLAGTALAAQLPYTGVNAMGNSLGALFNGGTQQSQSVGATKGPLDYLMGTLSPAAVAFGKGSDRRLKTDIEEIGDWDDKGDGLKRYRYRYTFDPTKTVHEGVMADEVAKLRPQAFIPNYIGDRAGVNYAAL